MSAAGERREAVILAGGRSRRMGSEKALLELGGGTVIERLVHLLGASFDRMIIATGAEPPSAGLEAALQGLGGEGFDLMTVKDLRPDFAGPLAGVEAALTVVEGSHAFFVPVDILRPEDSLRRKLLDLSCREGFQGAVPRCGGVIQGAFAVYSRSLLPRISSLLDAGENRLGVLASLDGVEVVEVEPADFFTGFNTPQEYAAARLELEADEG